MKSVFAYTDYRDFLRDFYQNRKDTGKSISYRIMGKKLQVDPSLLVKILRGERHLTQNSMQLVAKYTGLNEQETLFFEQLYHFSQAQTDQEITLYFEAMKKIAGVGSRRVALKDYGFYHSWRNVALWGLIHIQPDLSVEEYAQLLFPTSSVAETQSAADVLVATGMVQQDTDGNFSPAERHLESGKPVDKRVMRDYYRQMLKLAEHSLDQVSPEKRDISGITVAIDENALGDIREIILDARKKIQMRVDEVKEANRVMQVSFQVFPLTSEVESAPGDQYD